MKSGGNAWLKGEEAPCRPVVDDAPVYKAVEEIRATNPMAGSITNTVTIDFVANAQLAVGGSAGTRAALRWSWRALWA